MIRIIIILFLLISPVKANCKYYAEVDIKDNKIINKKEKYICNEKENFFVTFLTDEKYHQALTMSFLFVLENL